MNKELEFYRTIYDLNEMEPELMEKAPHVNSEGMTACLDLPYPKPMAKEKNCCYACIISSLFAGRVASELTAFTSYTYGAITYGDQCPDAHETLHAIAMCELNHLKMLGHLLVSLGEKPQYYGCEYGRMVWWQANPNTFSYPSCLKMVLLDGISAEHKAIEHYRDAMKEIEDENIQVLIRRIILDEEHHIKLLTQLYERCCK